MVNEDGPNGVGICSRRAMEDGRNKAHVFTSFSSHKENLISCQTNLSHHTSLLFLIIEITGSVHVGEPRLTHRTNYPDDYLLYSQHYLTFPCQEQLQEGKVSSKDL